MSSNFLLEFCRLLHLLVLLNKLFCTFDLDSDQTSFVCLLRYDLVVAFEHLFLLAVLIFELIHYIFEFCELRDHFVV